MDYDFLTPEQKEVQLQQSLTRLEQQHYALSLRLIEDPTSESVASEVANIEERLTNLREERDGLKKEKKKK